MLEFKRCSECEQRRPLSSFHRDANRKDGLNPVCKGCVRNRHLKRYVPKLVKATGPCDACGAKRKVMKDGRGKLCGLCRLVARLVSRDPKKLDRLADYLDNC